jgi:hypothetical protein
MYLDNNKTRNHVVNFMLGKVHLKLQNGFFARKGDIATFNGGFFSVPSIGATQSAALRK